MTGRTIRANGPRRPWLLPREGPRLLDPLLSTKTLSMLALLMHEYSFQASTARLQIAIIHLPIILGVTLDLIPRNLTIQIPYTI